VEGNQAVALDQLKSLLLSHPKNAEVFDLMALVYRSMGKDNEAQQAEAQAKLLRQREIK
jgi:predicted Zn-dependent protease